MALVLRLWHVTVALILVPALSPAAASFQDHNLDLKTSRIDKLKQGTLLWRGGKKAAFR